MTGYQGPQKAFKDANHTTRAIEAYNASMTMLVAFKNVSWLV